MLHRCNGRSWYARHQHCHCHYQKWKHSEGKVGGEKRIRHVHYRDSIYWNTWTRSVVRFTAKRDSENIIDCKTRRVMWFLNDTCFHVIKSLLSVDFLRWLQTRVDSFGRILGAGVQFPYVSNVKTNSGSLRNLSFKVETYTSPTFRGQYMWPVQEHIRRPESPVPIEYWVAHDLYFSRTPTDGKVSRFLKIIIKINSKEDTFSVMTVLNCLSLLFLNYNIQDKGRVNLRGIHKLRDWTCNFRSVVVQKISSIIDVMDFIHY